MMVVVGDVIMVAGDGLCDYHGSRGWGDKDSGVVVAVVYGVT